MFSTPVLFLFLLRTTFVLFARPLTLTCQKSQQFNARKSLWLMSMIKFSLDNCWTKGLFLFITYFVVTCLCCSLLNLLWALAWQRNKARGQRILGVVACAPATSPLPQGQRAFPEAHELCEIVVVAGRHLQVVAWSSIDRVFDS